MAVTAGPKIIKDNLVMYMDKENTVRSWKGKPTVNYWYENGGGGATIISVDDLPEIEELAKLLGGKKNIRNPRRQSTQTNWLDLYNSNTGITVQPGEMLRLSCYVYTEKSTNRFNANANWGATLGTNAGMYASPDSHNIEPYKWHRITWRKQNTTESAISVSSSRIETYSTSEWSPDTIDAYCTNPQWEIGDFTTPFVDGTRSNTQAIIDIIGNRTVTATSLTYNSDNTFSFDGSADYFDTTEVTHDDPNIFSISCWLKMDTTPTDTNVGHPVFFNYGSSEGWFLSIAGTLGKVQLRHHNGSSTAYNLKSSTNLSTDEWYHITATDNDSTVKIYINGVLDASTSSAPAVLRSGHSPRIGNFGSFYFNGDISQMKIYNKALTANEVLTNFEASRDRYGV